MRHRLVLLAGLLTTAVLIAWFVFANRERVPTQAGQSATLERSYSSPVPSIVMKTDSGPRDLDTGRISAVVSDQDSGLSILVVDELDQPFSGALVVLHRDLAATVSALTDASGTARVPLPSEPMEVFVLSGTRVLTRGTVDAGARQARFVCSIRGKLRGRVLVDGGVPPERVQLNVRYPSAPDGPDELTPAEAALLSWRGLTGRAHEPLLTDPDGQFEILGLYRGWELEIRPDTHLWIAEDPEANRYHLSDAPILIRLTSRPTIRGRVLLAGAGKPASDATGFCEMECASGSTTIGVLAGDDGKFRVPLSCLPVQQAILQLSSRGAGTLQRTIVPVPNEGIDLGDLTLDAVVAVTVLVRDRNSLPILGASVHMPAEPRDLRDRSDSTGTVRLEIPVMSAQTLLVEALGFMSSVLHLDPGEADVESPLVVVLASLPTLRVRVELVSPQERERLRVQLVCESAEPFRDGGLTSGKPVQVDLGAPYAVRQRSMPAADGRPAMTILDYALQGGMDLVIPGLDPSVPSRVLLLDPSDRVLAEHLLSAADLESGEAISWSIAHRPGGLRIRLQNAMGNPIQGTVTLGVLTESTSNVAGIAVLHPLWSESVSVIAQAPGYAPRQMEFSILEGGWIDETIELGPARNLTVRAVNNLGASVRVDATIVRMNGIDVGNSAGLPDGGVQITDLPNAAFELHAKIGTAWVRRQVGEDEASVLLKIE